MRTIAALLLIFALILQSCNISPKPISYGNDICQYCSMTIVDAQHAAELVTDKGKVFKFDAVECMLNYKQEAKNKEVALHLCNHYSNPGELIEAEKATYLISEGIPSPMGAFLTAFEMEQDAIDAQNIHGGIIYNWTSLNKYWDDNYVYSE